MKKVHTTSIILLAIAIALSACKNAATSTNSDARLAGRNPANSNSASSQPSANNNNALAEARGNAQPTETTSPAAKLLGTYVMSEVHAGGVVNMMSQLKTELTFTADGSYTRVSKRNDNIYHVDAGQYRLEGNDQLVLVIRMGKQKVFDPPRERKHSFTLSRDGEELRLTSDDGKVAVFRKVKGG